MKAFMDENFLLSTPCAQHLYHEYAEHMPIYDYHCHLNPQGDRRKHPVPQHRPPDAGRRPLQAGAQMRAFGYRQQIHPRPTRRLRASFMAYAKAYCPMMIGNPLYHWTHLELQAACSASTDATEREDRPEHLGTRQRAAGHR